MSSIDKFGRRKGSHCVGHRGPQGVGFKLTSEKQYDIQGKQLKNIGDPTDEKDGATLNYVNLLVDACKTDILSAVQQSANLITDNLVAYIKTERNEIVDEVTKIFQNIKIKMDETISDMKIDLGKLKSDKDKYWEAHNKFLQDLSDFALDIEKVEQLIAKHHPPEDTGGLVFPSIWSKPVES